MWLAAAASAVVATALARSRANRWGVSDEELRAEMPGDALVPDSTLGYTRGINVEAPPEVVWSWLVQIGHSRGGLYSYDWAENLVGCDLHSANEIHQEWQRLRPNDLIRLGPEGYPTFCVVDVDPPHTLVLVSADPGTGSPSVGTPTVATWQWSIQPRRPGTSRLLVRQRLTYPRGQTVLWRAVEPVTFAMERKMLRGIKQRSENSRPRCP